MTQQKREVAFKTVEKLALTTEKKQKREVATLEHPCFLIVLKHTPSRVHAFNVASLC
jgi:hypothetical protein